MAKQSVCTVCGYVMPGENKFCGQCGRITNIVDDRVYFMGDVAGLPSAYPQQPEKVRGRGAAIVGMIFGILSLIISCIPALGLVLSLLGLIISCAGTKSQSGMATAGIVCSAIALVIALIVTVVVGIPVLIGYQNQ